MFHAHVYFGLNNIAKADALRKKIRKERQDAVAVFELVEKLVGPHKMPMFEFHFKDDSEGIIDWLDNARGDMSVLIHPVSSEPLLDHTERAIWLGRELGVFEEALPH
ncbi:DOPA 4,5-dioxygenase family protein [Vibrio sp. S9_S30]|uniref:DOPA 4,5-dioxygenase family protein n=1 Tax=Vibrio sp. S9_S30 TaxID=2720226 RepID=UPI0016819DF5|nr:DOPA 4,5-dioxygenase family protein [Vibrio sp. S9_S30]MBD1557599.1 DOPA 4,5-dioxygenase family protein [Vibrio sp. S9_S30]